MKRLGEALRNEYVIYSLNNADFRHSRDKKYTDLFSAYTIDQFSPRLFKLKKHRASNNLIYLFWFLVTGGTYKVIYLLKDEEVIHYSHILPRFFKLPFLSENDLEIGPSWTKESYRGKGIFPMIIKYVVETFSEKERNFYIFSHIDNISSQKAIEKAGFKMWTKCYKSGFLGIYKVYK